METNYKNFCLDNLRFATTSQALYGCLKVSLIHSWCPEIGGQSQNVKTEFVGINLLYLYTNFRKIYDRSCSISRFFKFGFCNLLGFRTAPTRGGRHQVPKLRFLIIIFQNFSIGAFTLKIWHLWSFIDVLSARVEIRVVFGVS